MLNAIFIVGVIALRHLPTLLNVDVDVNNTEHAVKTIYGELRKLSMSKFY